MFKHLVNKPSVQTVCDLIKNAVEIEQVTPTYTLPLLVSALVFYLSNMTHELSCSCEGHFMMLLITVMVDGADDFTT